MPMKPIETLKEDCRSPERNKSTVLAQTVSKEQSTTHTHTHTVTIRNPLYATLKNTKISFTLLFHFNSVK